MNDDLQLLRLSLGPAEGPSPKASSTTAALPNGQSWANLLPDILKHSLQHFIASVNASASARLVSRHWRECILLPVVILNDKPYQNWWQRMYTGDVILERKVEPIGVLSRTKSVKAASLGLQRHIFPVPQLLRDIAKLNTITRLDLSDNHIDEPLIDLLPITTSIKTLILARAHFKSVRACWDFFDNLKLNKSIQTLNLSGTWAFSAGQTTTTAGIIGCVSLTSLNVSQDGSKNEKFLLLLAEVIAGCARLQRLNLAANPLILAPTPALTAFADAIAANTTITSLDISKCELATGQDLAIFDAIRRNSTLTSINLAQINFLPNTSAQQLIGIIADHPTLRSVTLFGARPAALPNFETSLSKMFLANRITSIVLDERYLSVSDTQALFACSSLTSANLSNCSLAAACNHDERDWDFAAAVAQHPKLVSLNLRKTSLSRPVVGRLFAALATSRTLLHLNLASNHLGPQEAKALGPLLTENKSSIIFLDLSGSQFGYEGAEHISKYIRQNRTLLRLHLRSVSLRSSEQFELALAAAQSNLLELNMRSNVSISPSEAKRIMEAVSKPSLTLLFDRQDPEAHWR